jgi:hypothetical protein
VSPIQRKSLFQKISSEVSQGQGLLLAKLNKMVELGFANEESPWPT